LSITFELVADMVVLPDRSVCQVNQEEALCCWDTFTLESAHCPLKTSGVLWEGGSVKLNPPDHHTIPSCLTSQEALSCMQDAMLPVIRSMVIHPVLAL